MKAKIIAALAAAGISLAGGTAIVPAQASVSAHATAAAKTPKFCRLTVKYFFFANKDKPHHMIAEFFIHCTHRPAHIRETVQIEWFNPTAPAPGGLKGAWVKAPAMSHRFAPREIMITKLDELPKAPGTKFYHLASHCILGEHMAVHVFGYSIAPPQYGSVETKVNIRLGEGIYC